MAATALEWAERYRVEDIAVVSSIEHWDPEARRLERIRRTLDDKCPKLAAWTNDGRTSVLALESNDIQLSNAFVISDAVQQALKARNDQPDVVVLSRPTSRPCRDGC